MKDDEGGTGNQGLYHGTTPKLAATYLHNMTTLLSDTRTSRKPGSLAYVIRNQPATVHDLLLQKSNGRFELVVWDERVHGMDVVTVGLGETRKTVKVFDITNGTDPIQTLSHVTSVRLTLSDHAMIIESSH
jgi:hypothetical protein